MSMKRAVVSVVFCLLPVAVHAGDFRLSSPVLNEDGWLPFEQTLDGFGCTGPNLSPAMAWENVPPGTQSIALTLYDPDAPTGSGWWHWVVINIPADVPGLAAGAGNPAGHRSPGRWWKCARTSARQGTAAHVRPWATNRIVTCSPPMP